MSKILDLNLTVYELCQKYPELKDVMVEIGFKDIAKPMALKTVGHVMTIPKGAGIKDMDIDEVIEKLKEHGFEPTYSEEKVAKAKAAPEIEAESEAKVAPPTTPEERTKLLKEYLNRLGEGESLEQVRKEFVANFSEVDPLEIAMAEQSLIKSGYPVEKVKNLCDIHSALFHGKTTEEKIANAEKAVMSSMKDKDDSEKAGKKQEKAPAMAAGKVPPFAGKMPAFPSGSLPKGLIRKGSAPFPIPQPNPNVKPPRMADRNEAKSLMQEYRKIPGHPIQIFDEENKALGKVIAEAREAINTKPVAQALPALEKMRSISGHYSKKGDLIYPLLKTKYGVTGPSDVMWTVDTEVRDDFRIICQSAEDTEEWKERALANLKRAEEMIYKEDNILFPICVQFFAEDEWPEIRQEINHYAPTLIDGYQEWEGMKTSTQPEKKEAGEDEIVLAGGHFTKEQLAAVLDTIPLEITFIDENDINCFFNDGEGEKIFKRPKMAIGREVYSCHPPKVEQVVRGIIGSFKSGEQDQVAIWHTMTGEPVLGKNMAVRDKQGKYLGTMECVQKMGFAKEHFEKN